MFPYFFLIVQCLLLFQNESFVAIWLFVAHEFLMNIQIVFALSNIQSFLSDKIFILHGRLDALSYILSGYVSLAYSWSEWWACTQAFILDIFIQLLYPRFLLFYELEESLVDSMSVLYMFILLIQQYLSTVLYK